MHTDRKSQSPWLNSDFILFDSPYSPDTFHDSDSSLPLFCPIGDPWTTDRQNIEVVFSWTPLVEGYDLFGRYIETSVSVLPGAPSCNGELLVDLLFRQVLSTFSSYRNTRSINISYRNMLCFCTNQLQGISLTIQVRPNPHLLLLDGIMCLPNKTCVAAITVSYENNGTEECE